MVNKNLKTWFQRVFIEVIAGIIAAVLFSSWAALKGYFETSPIISTTIVISGTLLIIFIAWGIRRIAIKWPIIRLGMEANKIFSVTTEIIDQLTPQKINDLFKSTDNPERSVYKLINEFVGRCNVIVPKDSCIQPVLNTSKALLANLKHIYRLQRSLETLVSITSQLVRLTREEDLSRFFNHKKRWTFDEREISELLGCLEHVFENILMEKVVAVLKIPKDKETLKVIHSVKADPARVAAEPSLPINGSIGGYVLTKGVPLVFGSLDDSNLERTGITKEAWSDRDKYFNSGILYPVKVNGKTVAALGVDCKLKNAFEKDTVIYIRYAADCISIMFQISTFLDKLKQGGNVAESSEKEPEIDMQKG